MPLKIENEIKINSDPCVLALHEKLYVGTESGEIKSYTTDLNEQDSWVAHDVQLFALEASGDCIYSSSNDGGIRVWSTTSIGNKTIELPGTGADIGVLRLYGDQLYAGDEGGNVFIYEKGKVKARYNVVEEVKDLYANYPLLYTVRDLDVTITEIKADESKWLYTTKHTMEGRAPLRVLGPYLLVVDRGGHNLCLYSAEVSRNFKKFDEMKVSDMLITSLAAKDNNVWVGGWDGHLKRYHIIEDKIHFDDSINLGSCINALLAISSELVFAALAGGRVVSIKATKE